MAKNGGALDARKMEGARVGLEHVEAAEEAARTQGKALRKAFDEKAAKAKALEAELAKVRASWKQRIDVARKKAETAMETAKRVHGEKLDRLTAHVMNLRAKQAQSLATLA